MTRYRFRKENLMEGAFETRCIETLNREGRSAAEAMLETLLKDENIEAAEWIIWLGNRLKE